MSKIGTCSGIFFAILCSIQLANAQVKEESELFQDLKNADNILFEKGFNECDMEKTDQLIHQDFEFYHDEGGVQNREEFFKAITDNICSSKDRKPIRKLVEGTLKVFRLKNNGKTYGAIQKGKHLFYIKEPNKELYLTSIASFTHLFVLQNDQWKLKRVLSYDHHEPPKFTLPYELDKQTSANSPEPLFDKDDKINQLLKKHNIASTAIGFIDRGKLTQIRVFGHQKAGDPISIDSIYKVASLTKPITAMVALKLINQGKLDLDEPVYKYYIDPDISKAPELRKLTIRHILSHQSGFKNWRYLTKSNKLAFEFEPGTRTQYSGEGFEYLRKILEIKFNKSLEVLADELIFKPLDMRDTHYYWSADVDEKRYSVEHNADGKVLAFKKHTKANAAANLLTTIADYGKFMVHILDGAGLSKALYAEMITPQSQMVNKDVDFGLGWEIFNNLGKGEFALQHSGKDPGVNTLAIIFPNSKKGLIIFTNSETGIIIWRKILKEYFGELGMALAYKKIKEN